MFNSWIWRICPNTYRSQSLPSCVISILLENLFIADDGQIFSILFQAVIKLSYLAFYLRLSGGFFFQKKNKKKTKQKKIYNLMVLVMLYGIIGFGVSCALCVPLSKLWNPEEPGTCLSMDTHLLAATAFSIFFDLIIILLPIPILLKLKCKWTARVLIFCYCWPCTVPQHQHSDNIVDRSTKR